MTLIDKVCAACGKPLTEINGNRDYFMHLCETQGCLMSRQPQGYREKNPDTAALWRGQQKG